MKVRSILSFAAASVVVAAAAAALAALLAFRYFDAAPIGAARAVPNDPGVVVESSGSYLFVVGAGESAATVGARLEAAGLIRSGLLWRLVARLDAAQIKTGTYRINGGSGMLEIRELFVSGRQLLVKATIPEGSTLKKIASILDSKGIVDESSFLAAAVDPELLKRFGIRGGSFEGFLFPETYLFPLGYAAENVIDSMVSTFFQRVSSIAPKPLGEYGADEMFERVVLASIVEREYRVDDEAPIIAGVFRNRLRIGMALQSCATIEYVITEIQGKPHPEVIYNRDLEIRDPYNTYLSPGLPPGAISSPGLVALDAAFNPASVNYLYFRLVDPAAGRHRFSRTLDEHIEAGVRYVKRVR